MAERWPILYMSGTLPTRSETFVYREIQALRELGVEVHTASVHAPAEDLDERGPLNQMARESTPIYSSGIVRLIRDALAEFAAHPSRALATIIRALNDAIFSNEVPWSRTPKVVAQGIAGLALTRRVRAKGIRHIHAHMAHVPTTIGMYAARQLNVTFSFTGHANDLFPNRTLLREKLERALFVSCISRWHRAFYRGIIARDDADYPIIRCGVDTEQYEATPAPRGEKLLVLGVGRLVEKKGFDVLIEAAGEIARAGGPPMRVVIAGGGPDEQRLRKLVDELPPTAEVELLGDTDNETVLDLMSSVDVFALPCRVASSGDRDGIPVVLMEAMARGRCVISGDLETIRELIEHDKTGIMIRPGDREGLEEALIALAKDRDRVDRLGAAAREHIESEFDLRLNAKRILTTMRLHGLKLEAAP